jgi:hypothetical protein
LRSDGQDRHAAALAIVQAIDQMQISGPAASGAYGQFVREMGLRAGRERRSFLMAYTNPLNIRASANRIRDAIERIAWYPVNSLNPRLYQDVYQKVCDSFRHVTFPSVNFCAADLAL